MAGFISDRTARALITVGGGFVAVTNLLPGEGEDFKFPSFQDGVFTVYGPALIALLAMVKIKALGQSKQQGILIVLTLLLVGGQVVSAVQTRSIDAKGLIGSVVPFIGAASLAA